jgi:hypothetical protein
MAGKSSWVICLLWVVCSSSSSHQTSAFGADKPKTSGVSQPNVFTGKARVFINLLPSHIP